MRKQLSWCVTIQFPGLKPVEIGNFLTPKFNPEDVRQLAQHWIRECMPEGYEIIGIRRGRLVFQPETD